MWEGVYTERHADKYGGRVPSVKVILSFTDSEWSALRSGLMCSCLLLLCGFKLFQPGHLITVDVNEQKVWVTDNKRTQQLISVFSCQDMANSSDIEIYWMFDVVTMLYHRQTSIKCRPRDFLTWAWKRIWLPTPKWLSCDTLTLLQDPTKSASVCYKHLTR